MKYRHKVLLHREPSMSKSSRCHDLLYVPLMKRIFLILVALATVFCPTAEPFPSQNNFPLFRSATGRPLMLSKSQRDDGYLGNSHETATSNKHVFQVTSNKIGIDDESRTKELSQIRQDVHNLSSDANDLLHNKNKHTASLSRTKGTVSEGISRVTILLLGTYATSSIFADLLARFEWFQSWRYFWPLVGGLYILDALRGFYDDDNEAKATNVPADCSSEQNKSATRLLLPLSSNSFHHQAALGRFMTILSGMGLIIGGAYDAFMPVWYTGPNVVTEAGIGQDGAAALLLLTAFGILQTEIGTGAQQGEARDIVEGSRHQRILLMQTLLLAQLYKLSECSFDVVGTNTASLLFGF